MRQEAESEVHIMAGIQLRIHPKLRTAELMRQGAQPGSAKVFEIPADCTELKHMRAFIVQKGYEYLKQSLLEYKEQAEIRGVELAE